MNFDAIIFDLDGTLVDSLEDIADSMNRVLEAAGLPIHPIADYRYFVGDGIDMLTQRALPDESRSAPEVEHFVAAMKAEYSRHLAVKSRPYPKTPQLIAACRAAGLKTAVLSNRPHDPTVEMVDRLLADSTFEHVWGAKPEMPKKPDPAGAVEMARTLGVLPERCLYLGDMPVDMQTAAAAGMYAAGALWGFRCAEELLAAGAQALFRSPEDLLTWMALPLNPELPLAQRTEFPLTPRPAVGAVVFHQARVLLVRRGKPPAAGVWAIPGGSVLLGETLQAAAEREIFEETGIRILAGDPVLAFDVLRTENGRVRFHYVIVDLSANYIDGEPRAGDDALEARWVSTDELTRLDVNPATRRLLKEKFGFG
ncbi:MAG: HAD hydrolase-like protein [Desulfobacterales bacterium]|nr:HAD hydrolase-like protein [Desulfobacterales bacterium]